MSVGPRTFKTLADGDAWLQATFAGWLAQLTEPERRALAIYKGDDYREINAALRGVALSTESIETTVEDLDVAIARMTLPEPVVAWRAIAIAQLAQAPDDLVGDVVEEAAYVSTSLLREVALAHLHERAREGEGVLERIYIPGASRVAVAVHAAAPDLIADLEEAELLLPRGTRLRVTADDRDTLLRNLEMEVLP